MLILVLQVLARDMRSSYMYWYETGACAGKADLSDMTVEQKTAFASYCSVDFPCQVCTMLVLMPLRSCFCIRGVCRVGANRTFATHVPGEMTC